MKYLLVCIMVCCNAAYAQLTYKEQNRLMLHALDCYDGRATGTAVCDEIDVLRKEYKGLDAVRAFGRKYNAELRFGPFPESPQKEVINPSLIYGTTKLRDGTIVTTGPNGYIHIDNSKK